MSFTAEPHTPPLPIDFRRIWENAEWLTPKEFGFAMLLMAEVWQAPGHRIRFNEAVLCRLFSNGVHPDWHLTGHEVRNALAALFWFDEREGFIYSPDILELVGRPVKRTPIPRWMKDEPMRHATASGRLPPRCHYCMRDIDGDLHYDHALPISRGGINHPQNLRVTCAECNMVKGAMTEREFMAALEAEEARQIEAEQ